MLYIETSLSYNSEKEPKSARIDTKNLLLRTNFR
jgi:hypothetical protein